ncbi:MAG: cytochrome c/FTR1 family iron permease [Pseudomonadota bacterium]
MRRVFLLILVALLPVAAHGATPKDDVQTAWRLLDYLAVDYGGAVRDGRVISKSEYAEMREFSATVEAQLRSLPAKSQKAALVGKAQGLEQAIDGKASPDRVAAIARGLGADLLAAYPVPLAPQSAPDIGRGAALYSSTCAACHGAAGDGHGLNAAKLNPPPIAFADRTRASQRSTFALYQVISQGIDGTAMQRFADLPAQDRWALAFRVGTFAYPKDLAAEGERLWKSDATLRQKIPDLKTLVSLTPQALAKEVGQDKAVAVIAYLRSSPQAVEEPNAGSLTAARTRLAESVAAYRAGDRDGAKRLALSAYLDGFEPVEPSLSARDASLMHEIEGGMGELRSRIARGEPVERVQQQAQLLDGLFSRAESRLGAGPADAVSTFLSALTILLREGIEALLIVVAMAAFLRRSEREDALPYVHGGWITALVAGGLTWFAATEFLSISGASRELTEGFGGIIAAVVLVSVGIWMHGKAQAGAWQRYIQDRMSGALTKQSAWFVFGLAFIVVYREVFETILFYVAMWTEGSKAAVLSGAGVGAAGLAVIGWTMLRYSVKLPISQFFRYSSILIAVLAVVLAGKGIAAIQEAGLLGVTPLPGVPQIEVVGLFPSAQVILAQLLVIVALVAGFWWSGHRGNRRDPAGA